MDFLINLIRAANASMFASDYHKICTEHSFNGIHTPVKLSSKEIISASTGVIKLTKLNGTGAVYKLDDLPYGLSLNLIIQSGGTIETDFKIEIGTNKFRGSLASLYNETMQSINNHPPKPPYPRPECSSAINFVTVVLQLKEIILKIHKELTCEIN
jgi:hypothetical protein